VTYLNALRNQRLRFCLRATVNALLAFGLTHVLAVPFHGLWAVVPAVVMIQTSIGGSLKAAAEYTIGTIAGAVYAGAVAAVLPHATVLAFAGVLALAIAPLAYAAAISPSFRTAPVTAVLVLMISAQLGETPIELAFERALEVAAGSAMVIAVSLLVFPARAHELGLVEAARVLEHLARVLPAVLAGFRSRRDPLENARLQDDVGDGVHALAAVAREAKPERLVHLAPDPDPAVLARTLLRVRHDLVMIGRAASAPLPDPVAARLGPALTQIGTTARHYFAASARALSSRNASPPAKSIESAIVAYLSELASISADGLMDGLPSGEQQRIGALSFALQQLRENLAGLAACVHDWTRNPEERRASPRQWYSKRVALRLASMLPGFETRLRLLYQSVSPGANRPAQLPAAASLSRAAVSFRHHIRALGLALVLIPTFAHSTFAYDDRPSDPFGGQTIELNEGPLVRIWETLRDKVLDDKLRIQSCDELGNESCPEVFKLMNMVAEARQNEGRALIGHLNRSINLAIMPAPVNWTGPLEPMKVGKGDCKAYSIAKYVGALETGMPMNYARVVIVHDKRHHEYHMVTAVYENDGWLVLDNLTMLLLRDSETRDYEPVAVLDHKGVRGYPASWVW
jgi:predicted transglutaminase-like cysteine proteinase